MSSLTSELHSFRSSRDRRAKSERVCCRQCNVACRPRCNGSYIGLIRCEDDNDSARAESPGYQCDVKQSAVNRRLLLKVAMEKCTQQNKGFERE